MKINFRLSSPLYVFAAVMLFTACKKDVSVNDSTTTDLSTAVAVPASASQRGTASSDSVYVVGTCTRDQRRDSIAASGLPASITTYLTSNYAGYIFHKAFAVKNQSGTVNGYVVIIFYNDKPVGLAFDASGNFVKVLEQRERGDLNGPGWHHGGRFDDRGNAQKDSIALSALPSGIISYLSLNYGSDTLVKAFINRHDTSYVVITRNNGVFANIFDKNGTFIKRVQLNNKQGNCQSIDQSALPAAVTTYLSTTYPGYAFKRAFVIQQNGATAGYVVLIDANNTKYAVEFDASGSFVRVKVLH